MLPQYPASSRTPSSLHAMFASKPIFVFFLFFFFRFASSFEVPFLPSKFRTYPRFRHSLIFIPNSIKRFCFLSELIQRRLLLPSCASDVCNEERSEKRRSICPSAWFGFVIKMPPAAAWSGGVMKVGSGANRRNPLIFFETQRPLFAADFSQHELISNRTLFYPWFVVMMMDRRVSKAARDSVFAHLLALRGTLFIRIFPC